MCRVSAAGVLINVQFNTGFSGLYVVLFFFICITCIDLCFGVMPDRKMVFGLLSSTQTLLPLRRIGGMSHIIYNTQ